MTAATARVAGEFDQKQLVPQSWSALKREVSLARYDDTEIIPARLEIGKYVFKLIDLYTLQHIQRLKYEYERGQTAIYVYFEYEKSGKDDVQFHGLTVQVDAPGIDFIEAYDPQPWLGLRVDLKKINALINETIRRGKKEMRDQATARVAGETHGVIDADRVRHIVEEDDYDEAELLQLVNIDKLRFKEIDADYTNGSLKWISLYMKQGGFKYRLTLNYKQGAFTSYELSAEPAFAHSLMVEKKFKSAPQIKPSSIQEAFVQLKQAVMAKMSSLLKTPASFQLGRFNMAKAVKRWQPEDKVLVTFESRERDSESTAMVLITLDITNRKIFELNLNGSMCDAETDESFVVTEDGPAALRRALAVEFKSFDDVLRVLNSSKDLNKLLAELKPECGREERVIRLNVKNHTPISESMLKHPESLFNDHDDAFVIFKDAATRNTALEALRKVISDNGGRIVYENELKLEGNK